MRSRNSCPNNARAACGGRNSSPKQSWAVSGSRNNLPKNGRPRKSTPRTFASSVRRGRGGVSGEVVILELKKIRGVLVV